MAENGGKGDDILEGGVGADLLDGGDGNDTVTYQNATSEVAIKLGGYNRAGEAVGDQYASIENVIGSAFADHIWGNGDNNILNGGDGDDFLSGAVGADIINGGRGYDTASYEDAKAPVVVNLLD